MKGILFASFGTTYSEARKAQIDSIATCMAVRWPEAAIGQAYTSNMVRRILRERGVEVADVKMGLEALLQRGVRDVVVQPGHLLPGEEYDKLCYQAESCRAWFERLRIGAPLISGTDDLQRLAEIVSEAYPKRKDTALILMGHGTPRFANVAYAAMNFHFQQMQREDVVVGTVEAEPDFDVVLRALQGKKYQRITLAPLMQVAGDHASNDMAGEEPQSWRSRLTAAGYQTICHLRGLGEMPRVQQMYLEHVRYAMVAGDGHGI